LIRVLVVAESAVARASLADVVGTDARIDLAGIAAPDELAARIGELRPDVVLAHYGRAPNDADLEHVPSVVLVDDAQGRGERDASASEIVCAIVAAAAGLIVQQPRSLVRPTAETALVEPLTPRERAVLERLALGSGNRDIAAQLHISEHTVKFHVASILAKLGASNRAEAVSRGVKLGFLML